MAMSPARVDAAQMVLAQSGVSFEDPRMMLRCHGGACWNFSMPPFLQWGFIMSQCYQLLSVPVRSRHAMPIMRSRERKSDDRSRYGDRRERLRPDRAADAARTQDSRDARASSDGQARDQVGRRHGGRPPRDVLGGKEDAALLRAVAPSMNKFANDGTFLQRSEPQAQPNSPHMSDVEEPPARDRANDDPQIHGVGEEPSREHRRADGSPPAASRMPQDHARTPATLEDSREGGNRSVAAMLKARLQQTNVDAINSPFKTDTSADESPVSY